MSAPPEAPTTYTSVTWGCWPTSAPKRRAPAHPTEAPVPLFQFRPSTVYAAVCFCALILGGVAADLGAFGTSSGLGTVAVLAWVAWVCS